MNIYVNKEECQPVYVFVRYSVENGMTK